MVPNKSKNPRSLTRAQRNSLKRLESGQPLNQAQAGRAVKGLVKRGMVQFIDNKYIITDRGKQENRNG